MDKKFELTKESIEIFDTTLYRIKALKDFNDVKAGDLGGFVEKEDNLSQEGNCWIYDNAKVYNNAIVCDNAEVYNKANVFNNARISGNAQVFGNAEVCGNASIYDNAEVFGNVEVYGDTSIYDNASAYDNAEVYGDAKVHGDAEVCDNAKVYNNAIVCGSAEICDNAIVNKEMIISNGKFTINTLEESVRCQTGLAPCNGEVIAYKRVNKDLTSSYDRNFKYVVGEWAEAKEPDISDKSCASGLHFSNATYWDNQVQIKNTTLLIAKIRLEDIITVQRGKIRCKRAFILGTYDI